MPPRQLGPIDNLLSHDPPATIKAGSMGVSGGIHMNSFRRRTVVLASGLLLLLGLPAEEDMAAALQPPIPQKLRLVAPETLQRGGRHLVHVEGLFDGKNWKRMPPDQFQVKVSGTARTLDDPAGKTMNPV